MEGRVRVSSGVRSDEDGIGVMEAVVGGAANDSGRWMEAACRPALFPSLQLIHLRLWLQAECTSGATLKAGGLRKEELWLFAG